MIHCCPQHSSQMFRFHCHLSQGLSDAGSFVAVAAVRKFICFVYRSCSFRFGMLVQSRLHSCIEFRPSSKILTYCNTPDTSVFQPLYFHRYHTNQAFLLKNTRSNPLNYLHDQLNCCCRTIRIDTAYKSM
jgi:hypothetical protein